MMIFRFYAWRDKLKEPWKFMSTLLIASPAILVLAFSSKPLIWLGIMYVLFLIITRAVWTIKKIKIKKKQF